MPLLAVLLGTDHHPFPRLVNWVSAVNHGDNVDVFVQHGHTGLPAGLAGQAMLDQRALTALLERANAVVTHGGPGLIMEARAAGHLPVVVPRDPRRREHVDDHQLRFAGYIGDAGLAVVARTPLELRLALVSALARGRSHTGLARNGTDPSLAFDGLVAHVLQSSVARDHRQ